MVAGTGLIAGTVNAIAGGGSLLSFPALLAVGYAPLTANVTNGVGIVPGTIGGAFGYRRKLRDQRRRLFELGVPGTVGGVAGAVVLLTTPKGVFEAIVPFLIAASCVLLFLQPRLARVLAERSHEHSPLLYGGIFLTGVYGGYFGAAIGVLLLAILGLFVRDGLQRLNAAKNVLAGLINGVSAGIFMIFGPVAWAAALLLATGSLVGGRLGAALAQRVPDRPLRLAIVAIGLVVAVALAVR